MSYLIQPIQKECKVCGRPFLAKNYNSNYCSAECRRLMARNKRKESEASRKSRAEARARLENNLLEQRLNEARSKDLTYAQLQIQKTLAMVREREANK